MTADGARTSRLADLLAETPGARLIHGDPNLLVTGVAFDSRAVRPGEVFVAIPGQRHDGRRFAGQAVERGAVAIAAEPPVAGPGTTAIIEVSDARIALADLAAAFFEHPSRRLKLIGVTGTDGKTTVARLCASLLEAHGLRSGWLTTVDVKVGSEVRNNDFGHTTPEAPGVQGFLAEMVDAEIECAALEVSSHSLALHRVRGCAFDVAVLTNLSPEHLNFHGSLEAYREAKATLFRAPQLGLAVLNADDPSWPQFAQATDARVVTYGVQGAGVRGLGSDESGVGTGRRARPDYWADDLELGQDGTAFTLYAPFAPGGARVCTRFVGRFNVANWLAAIAAATPFGVGLAAVERAADQLAPPRGRMEELRLGQPFRLVVDFSHTPQALETALDTLRQQTRGRLLVVFGQAGERDVANRPRMGEIAAEKADFFVLTTDDPLYEDPVDIARQIAVGAERRGKQEQRDFWIEPDRRQAIQLACRLAGAGDTVLLAGKGHERRMLVQDQRQPWSDQQVAGEVLAEMSRHQS